MNSRPLTVETLSDVTSYKPLSPSDLLIMKSKVVLPPAGKFQKGISLHYKILEKSSTFSQ